MKIVFMGTGDIAMPSFRALVESEFELVALITQPDKPVGRKQILTPPQIKTLAEQNGIPVLQPTKVRQAEVLDELRALDADVFVVMAYGQILPLELLEMPSLACINLHASILPKHRGASCIQTAISQGDESTGITVMHMTEGLDEGDVILVHETPIGAQETGGELHDLLADIAPKAMLEALGLLEKGNAPRTPQNDALSNYAPKLLRNDGEIDWTKSAQELERTIRAYDPWPGTFTNYVDAKGKQRRLKIFPPVTVVNDIAEQAGEVYLQNEMLTIQCGDGALALSQVQPEGKGKMEVSAFVRGGVIQSGDCLTSNS